VAANFARTKELFVLEGWCAQEDFAKLEQEIVEEFGKKAIVQPLHDHELPPTLLKTQK